MEQSKLKEVNVKEKRFIINEKGNWYTYVNEITGNCQLGGMPYFNWLLTFVKEDKEKFINELNKIGIYKSCILIDITERDYIKLKKFITLKKYCILNKSYTSTNNSKMRILILKIQEYLYDENKKKEDKSVQTFNSI